MQNGKRSKKRRQIVQAQQNNVSVSGENMFNMEPSRVYSANNEGNGARLNYIMSAPIQDGLGATEPTVDGHEAIKFTAGGDVDERNLNDEESFQLLHSLGNMGEQANRIYQTNDSKIDVEAPLEAKKVGNNIISRDNVVRDEYFSNKMIDIQQ